MADLSSTIARALLIRRSLSLWMIGLLLLSLGCRERKFDDLTADLSAVRLDIPQADYRSVAWLDQDHIAFSYRPKESKDQEAERRIGLLDVTTGAWRHLALPPLPEGCYPRPSGIKHLSRLPDGNLGFVQSCIGNGVSGRLYVWNKQTDAIHLRQAYQAPFTVSRYAFSPDMSEIIQGNAIGAGLDDRLVYVRRDGHIEQFLPHFARAREPSWSPSGRMIAFSGTETVPESRSVLLTWNEIRSLALQPWNLYVMDEDGRNVRLLVHQIGRPYQLKWSPTSDNLLAFAGDVYDTQGIWLLDLTTLELTRVWHQNTFYDWAPDGEQLVVVSEHTTGETKQTHPVILDLALPDSTNRHP